MKKMISNILLTAFLASSLMLTAREAENEATNELLDLMQFEKIMDDTINASVQMIKNQDPEMASHEVIVKKFFNKYMSASSLRDDISKIYGEVFTADEIKEIISFYKTKTGQKALEKMPQMMQRSMELAQSRIYQNIGELEELIKKDLAKQ